MATTLEPARHDDPGAIPPLPPHAPCARTHPWERAFAGWLLRRAGWQIRGQVPDVPKAVIIFAPHSSNWDGIWMYFATTAIGLDVCILGKPVLFRIPILASILRRYGGFPASQDPDNPVLDQAGALFSARERFWYALAPEGTRKPVTRWKIGFWKIAKANGVPIVPVYLHYPDKVVGIGPVFQPGDDMRGDIESLRDFYRPWQGKHHGLG
ncbi:1-acyl-sn-glycerol-3-phosphate acyltransferase [Cognatiluteimonas profundi]|uniref:1-acyl-sn-glycerol-3-phosphate acyltransferase n=1 Tax=Cognatiluteimonas profundi TaxID=2594501 RepID=UPI00131CECE9|nr:1-acyl-sn-glycerol-3-phosphate acyltransferase [Lysobacter profundi]